MSRGDYLGGLLLFAATVGAAGGAGVLVAVRRYGHLGGAMRALAAAVLATAALIAAHLVPVTLGVLTRGTAVAAAVLALVAAFALTRGGGAEGAARSGEGEPPAPPASHPPPAPPASHPLARWAVAGIWVLIAAWIAAWLRPRATTPVEGTDMLTFDLPIIATWISDRTIWQVTDFFPLQPHGAYPHNGDAIVAAALLPWKSDLLVRFVQLPFLALLGVAMYALARELGAPRAAAGAAGALALTLPIALQASLFAGLPDAVLWSTFVVGCAFLVRAQRSRRRADLVLAGLALGIAFGAKWYGPTSVAAVLLVWGAAALIGRERLRAIVPRALLVGGVIALAGGIWMLRNLVEYGSPFFPSGGGLFEVPEDPLREAVGFRLVDYAGDWEILRDFVWPAFRDRYGVSGLALPLGLVAGGWALLRARAEPALRAPAAVAVAALLIALIYPFLPYSALGEENRPVDVGANTRYALPGIFLAGCVLAAVAGRSRAGEAAFVAFAALAAVAGLADSTLDVGAGGLAVWILLGAALVAAGAWVARRWRSGRRPRPALVAAGAAVLALGVVAAGDRAKDDFFEFRYRGDPTFAWVTDHAPEGRRIGVAGVWALGGPPPTWPMHGPRIGNEVEFIGEIDDGQLRRYEGFPRWHAAASEFDLVLVGRAPHAERDWPARAGFRMVAESPRFRLFATGRRPAQAPSG